jgi:hypothetical protein
VRATDVGFGIREAGARECEGNSESGEAYCSDRNDLHDNTLSGK